MSKEITARTGNLWAGAGHRLTAWPRTASLKKTLARDSHSNQQTPLKHDSVGPLTVGGLPTGDRWKVSLGLEKGEKEEFRTFSVISSRVFGFLWFGKFCCLRGKVSFHSEIHPYRTFHGWLCLIIRPLGGGGYEWISLGIILLGGIVIRILLWTYIWIISIACYFYT